MATTTPFPFAQHRPADGTDPMETPKFQAKIDELIALYEQNLADSDKADADDHDFYTGATEALEQSLALLLDVPEEAFEAHYRP